MTTSHRITVDSFQFEYYHFRGGDEVMLAFHGFGEDAASFGDLTEQLRRRYTVLAINHLYHGNSLPGNEGNILRPGTLQKLVAALQACHGFEKFSLLGYSLGARIVLAIFELSPEKVRLVYLYAPDGIVMNRWYNMAIKYSLTKKLFLQIMKDPQFFLRTVRALRLLKLIPGSLEQFVYMHLRDEWKRRLVYNVWDVYQLILPDIARVKLLVKKYGIGLHLFFGKKDKIIRPSVGFRFMKGAPAGCKLMVLEGGHRIMTEKNLALADKNSRDR